MKVSVFTTYCWLLVSVQLTAQQGILDSLRQQLNRTGDDVQSATVLLQLSEAFKTLNWGDSCEIYAYQAISLARQYHRRDIEARCFDCLAQARMNDGEYDIALTAYDTARYLFRQYHIPYDTFRTLMHLAGANSGLGRLPAAIGYLDSMDAMIRPSQAWRAMMHARMMANVLHAQNRFEEALAYRRRAFYRLADTFPPSDQLRVFFGMAFDFNRLGQYDSAIHYIRQGISLAMRFEDAYMEWHFRGNLGMNLIKKGQYAEGLAAFEAADKLLPKVGNNICCGNGSYQALALVRLGRPREAQRYLQQAEAFLPDNAIERKNNLSTLVTVYEAMGDYARALSALKRLKTTEDSLVRREHQQASADLEIRYRTREQAVVLAEQQARLQRQRLLLAVAALVAFLLGAVAVQYRRLGQARQQATAAAEREAATLKSLDATKSRFFANISHEFRTPLTLILAPLDSAKAVIKEHVLREQLEAAKRSALQLLRLVEELLDLSRVEAGKLVLHPQIISLAAWLQERTGEFAASAELRRIRLGTVCDCAPGLTIFVDADKLGTVLKNLLSNALKYTDQGGQVVCEAHWFANADGHEGHLTLRVRDTGRGMQPEELSHIFERFYQGAASAEIGGTGIGLALSQELVRFMGGTLSVESTPNVGSVFSCSLPATAVPPAQLYRPEPIQGRPVVLVAEDHPDLRRYLEQVLGERFQVLLAEDGLEAWRCLEREHVDIVVSDLMMPRMDGLALLEQVRRQPAVFQDIPFVLLTARDLERDHLQGLRLGVDDYVTKPFDPALLLARLENLLALHQKRLRTKTHPANGANDSAELIWLKKAEQLVRERLDDPSLSIGALAAALHQSPRNLERTLKRLTGYSPVEFIREIRLQHARQLLLQKKQSSVAEVRQAVGIESAAYFSRIFTERFGIGPREMAQNNQTQ